VDLFIATECDFCVCCIPESSLVLNQPKIVQGQLKRLFCYILCLEKNVYIIYYNNNQSTISIPKMMAS